MNVKYLPTGEALQTRAKELGVILAGEQCVNIPGTGTVPLAVSEYELQRRVIEAERHLREHRLWMLAAISAAASAISAVGAWLAVIVK